jgi:hypothetical protein
MLLTKANVRKAINRLDVNIIWVFYQPFPPNTASMALLYIYCVLGLADYFVFYIHFRKSQSPALTRNFPNIALISELLKANAYVVPWVLNDPLKIYAIC